MAGSYHSLVRVDFVGPNRFGLVSCGRISNLGRMPRDRKTHVHTSPKSRQAKSLYLPTGYGEPTMKRRPDGWPIGTPGICKWTGGYCKNPKHHRQIGKELYKPADHSPVIVKALLLTLGALATGVAVALMLLPMLSR